MKQTQKERDREKMKKMSNLLNKKKWKTNCIMKFEIGMNGTDRKTTKKQTKNKYLNEKYKKKMKRKNMKFLKTNKWKQNKTKNEYATTMRIHKLQLKQPYTHSHIQELKKKKESYICI